MRRLITAGLITAGAAAAIIATGSLVSVRFAYEPAAGDVVSRTRPSPEAYDLWGRGFTHEEAHRLLASGAGRDVLSPRSGVVKIDDSLLRLGRRAFYKETFGNEAFLTDVVGILNGPLSILNVSKAVLALKGGGTTNLRVEVPATVTIGDRTFLKGSYLDTGLDVAKGALLPMGMMISFSGWRIRAGITFSLCHATVDEKTFKVIEGAPNQDLNAGLMLALGTNSAAYFMHTDVSPLHGIAQDSTRSVILSNGGRQALPNAVALEKAVDTALLLWPRGDFDSLTDLKADPTQIPVSFSWGNHPYGWSGNFMAGPFHGLSAQNNNVHALNSDSLLLADVSSALFDMDKEYYLATLLQNAANKRYRYDPATGRKPSDFLSAIRGKPEGPGLNQVVLPPTYPKGTLISPDGTLTSSPGYLFWEQNNAMSAWQNTLIPPKIPISIDAPTRQLGRRVFERAQCTMCHSGPSLTNHQVIADSVLGANAARARALQKTETNFAPAVLFAFDTPVPLPKHPTMLPVPTTDLDPRQISLAWAHNGSEGGYKVPALVGLYWSAPYLHDGGVAVGKNVASQLGLPGTVQRNVAIDAENSLTALLDRDLRSRVVAANHASPGLRRMNVEGAGHNYWVDSGSGFSEQEQRALILYLLSYEPEF